MTISIAYVTGPNQIVGVGTIEEQDDFGGRAVLFLRNVDEPEIEDFPVISKNGTRINDSDEWFTHLARHLP